MFLNRAKVHTYRIIVLIYKLSLKVRVSKVSTSTCSICTCSGMKSLELYSTFKNHNCSTFTTLNLNFQSFRLENQFKILCETFK